MHIVPKWPRIGDGVISARLTRLQSEEPTRAIPTSWNEVGWFICWMYGKGVFTGCFVMHWMQLFIARAVLLALRRDTRVHLESRQRPPSRHVGKSAKPEITTIVLSWYIYLESIPVVGTLKTDCNYIWVGTPAGCGNRTIYGGFDQNLVHTCRRNIQKDTVAILTTFANRKPR